MPIIYVPIVKPLAPNKIHTVAGGIAIPKQLASSHCHQIPHPPNGEVQRRQTILNSTPVALNRPLPRCVSWLSPQTISAYPLLILRLLGKG
jgi:hypothetical protein